jgi:hypothetical protein
MDTIAINHIKKYGRDNDRSFQYIRFLNKTISEYRLTALKSHGLVRQICHQNANQIEKSLQWALREYGK